MALSVSNDPNCEDRNSIIEFCGYFMDITTVINTMSMAAVLKKYIERLEEMLCHQN